jgi:hypothetical protein
MNDRNRHGFAGGAIVMVLAAGCASHRATQDSSAVEGHRQDQLSTMSAEDAAAVEKTSEDRPDLTPIRDRQRRQHVVDQPRRP